LVIHRLLKAIVKYYDEGHIQPVRPTKVFTADVVEDCFREMQQGKHIGKIVVSMCLEPGKVLSATKLPAALVLDPNASYLLAGGLGGLGKAISTWMVESGARHLTYLSRSAGKSLEDQAFFHELESQGCSALAVQGSVSNLADVTKAVAASSKPLKGILQMSMVLRDQSFTRMTHEEWTTAVAPKVDGTWNLHNATLDKQLDFFVCFSSISGIIGQPGQANYASGNTFLDAFVQYRQDLNLKATSINIGVMEDAGYLAQNASVLNKLRSTGAYSIRETELLDALTLAIKGPSSALALEESDDFVNTSQFAIGLRSTLPLADAANRLPWRRDRRFTAYHNDNAQEQAGKTNNGAASGKLQAFLQEASGTPEMLAQKSAATFLARQITVKLFDFLLRPVEEGAEDEIDVSHSLQDMGLDSLVAIEMRSWWKMSFGFDISVLEMLGMGSMQALGEHAAKGLQARWTSKDIGGGGGVDAETITHEEYLKMKMP
jgi:NAD(P)-dependent dehydrogenase (short-subunit alcohol dehydrogenase family)